MFRHTLAFAVLAGGIGFGAALAATPRPSAVQVPSSLQHTFLVFFEEDKAGLTPEGRDIMHSAARAARNMGAVSVSIMVPSSQAGLAQARSQAVKAALLQDGVKARAIVNAGQPQDIAYADADPVVRAWLDRRAVVVLTPAPDAASGPQARLIDDVIR